MIFFKDLFLVWIPKTVLRIFCSSSNLKWIIWFGLVIKLRTLLEFIAWRSTILAFFWFWLVYSLTTPYDNISNIFIPPFVGLQKAYLPIIVKFYIGLLNGYSRGKMGDFVLYHLTISCFVLKVRNYSSPIR